MQTLATGKDERRVPRAAAGELPASSAVLVHAAAVDVRAVHGGIGGSDRGEGGMAGSMTRDEAIAIRTQQLAGACVAPRLLQEAIEVIKATNEPLTDAQFERMRHSMFGPYGRRRLAREGAA